VNVYKAHGIQRSKYQLTGGIVVALLDSAWDPPFST